MGNFPLCACLVIASDGRDQGEMLAHSVHRWHKKFSKPILFPLRISKAEEKCSEKFPMLLLLLGTRTLVIDRNPIEYFQPNLKRNRNAVGETESKPQVNSKYYRI